MTVRLQTGEFGVFSLHHERAHFWAKYKGSEMMNVVFPNKSCINIYCPDKNFPERFDGVRCLFFHWIIDNLKNNRALPCVNINAFDGLRISDHKGSIADNTQTTQSFSRNQFLKTCPKSLKLKFFEHVWSIIRFHECLQLAAKLMVNKQIRKKHKLDANLSLI